MTRFQWDEWFIQGEAKLAIFGKIFHTWSQRQCVISDMFHHIMNTLSGESDENFEEVTKFYPDE